jgi:hypothetical protein
MSTSVVLLECVAIGSKLKVKMRTQGFIMNANCQFPRDLRVAGRKFEVNADAVKLMRAKGGTYFYSVKDKQKIRVIGETSSSSSSSATSLSHIYEDTECNDCVVCLCEAKTTVMVPCGHFYTCQACSARLTTCPMCRAPITDRIDKSLVDV